MKLLFTAITLLVSINIFANIITWNELEKLALENAPEIKSSEKSVDSLRKLKHASYAGHLPKVSLFAREFDSKTTLKDQITVETDTDGRKYGLQAQLNIFDGLNTTYNIKKAEGTYLKSKEQLNLKKNSFYYKLRNNFINLYITQKRLKLFEKIKKRKLQNIRYVNLKYKGGLEPKWSVDKAEAEYLEIIDEKEQLIIERDFYRNYIGSIIGAKNILINNDVSIGSFDLEAEIKFNIDKKINHYPELEILKQDLHIAKNDLKLAYSEFSPTFNLAFEQSITKTDHNPDQEERSIALNINIPLFDGFSSYNKVVSNRYNIESYNYRKKMLKDDLAERLKKAIKIYKIKTQKIPTAKKILAAANLRKEVIDKQYRSGSKSFINWEQAEVKLIEAEKNEITVLSDALQAHAWLMYVSGRKLGDK